MIDILPAPPHVAAFHFTDTLTAADYDLSIAEIEARLAGHDRIAVFTDLTGMTGVTPAAMARDLRFAIGKVGEFRRFARAAVVTERNWLAGITHLGAMLFPRTEIRTYTAAQRDEAFAWASEALPAPGASEDDAG